MAGNAVAPGSGVVAAKKPPSFFRFALMDSQKGTRAAPSALGPLQAALGFSAAKPDGALQAKVDDIVAKNKDVARTSFAVIDLTKGGMRYAGHRATTPFYPASMGKLMVMLGAFQLRFDLGVLAAKHSLTDVDDVFDKAAQVWTDIQTPASGSAKTVLRTNGPKIELEDHAILYDGKRVDMGAYAKVVLDKVFDKKGGVAPLKFKSDGLGYHQQYYIDYAGERSKFKKTPAQMGLTTTDVSKLAFLDRLNLMIGFSNNEAPGALLLDTGMVAAQSPLWRSGLFDPQSGGLWLSSGYNGVRWRNAPGGGTTTGTALALVTLFAAIWKDAICDADSCREMRFMMKKAPSVWPSTDLYADPTAWAGVPPGAGTRSFIEDGLNAAGISATVHSKLGIYKGYSDTAHVSRLAGAKRIDYVMSILDVAEDNFAALGKAAQLVDDAVVAIN